MAVLAFVLIAIWLLLVGGLRGYLQSRRTGAAGLRFADRRSSAQWWARLLSSIGLLVLIAAPAAELAGLSPIAVLDHAILRWGGVVLVGIGVAATLLSQAAMGASWRGDVDPNVRTALVTGGPFAVVRNLVLTATATTALGLALMVPNVLAAAALAFFVVTYQIQVRLVEEPYLERVHRDAYRRYAERTGRFLPCIGRRRRT